MHGRYFSSYVPYVSFPNHCQILTATAAAAQSLRGIIPLQKQYDLSRENFRTLNEMYNAEKQKFARLETELQKVRADYRELEGCCE